MPEPLTPPAPLSPGLRELAADGADRARPERASPSGARPRFAAQRVLVVRLGSLGDVVRTRFALPGLRELYPEARIDWLVEDRSAPGLVGVREIDDVIAVPRRELRASRPDSLLTVARQTVDALRARQYDVAVDFHSILKSALLIWSARIPVRVGYDRPLAREGAQRLFSHRLTGRVPSHVSRFERNAALVEFLGARRGHGARLPGLELEPADRDSLPSLPRRFVVLHPGTSASTLYKRWEPERYAQVAREIADELGLPCVVTWGPVPGEREGAQQVVALAPRVALLGPATRSLGALLALLQRSSLFIGSDSGPLHLASLAGRPCVVLCGPTDPVENAPFSGVPSRLLRVDVGCNPCREGCPARTCMGALRPAEVVRAAVELLRPAS